MGKGDAHVFVSIEGGQQVEVYIEAHIIGVGCAETLFQCSFEVVMSAVRVVSSPG